MRRLMTLALAASALAGCVDADGPGVTPLSADPVERVAAIAIVDIGVNPYHEAFRSVSSSGGAPAETILSISRQGSWEERVEADRALWEGVQSKTLYRIEGTRLLVISFSFRGDVPVLDHARHGTAVAGVASAAAPEADIVIVQVTPGRCLDPDRAPPRCVVDENVLEGLRWVAAQPWIQVVNLAFGLPGNAPVPGAFSPEARNFQNVLTELHAAGKLVVASAGNEPGPVTADYTNGPPSLIVVGGAEGRSHGHSAAVSWFPDVASNYTVWAPEHDSTDGFEWRLGTSFAAPMVAGTISSAWTKITRAGTVVDPPDIRSALNATARAFTPTDFDPTASSTNDTVINALNPAVPVLAPALQQGWGYVDASLADEIARRVIEKDFAVPDDARAKLMREHHALRERYWRDGGP